MAMAKELHPSFRLNFYLFRRKVLKLFGGAFHVYDEHGNIIFFSEQKAFKLKEDFRVYSNEQMEQELLSIKTPHVLDISATYQIKDATTNETVGEIRRKGLKSIFKDEWLFFSPDGTEIGKLTETSTMRALFCRLIKLIPQSYHIVSNQGNTIADIKQHFNPFVLKYSLNLQQGDLTIDKRLIIAAGILLAGIEGRQQ